MRKLLWAWLFSVALIFAAGQCFGQLPLTGAGKFPGGAVTFATFDPANKNANVNLTAGNLTATNGSAGNFGSVRGTTSHSTGKYYAEFTIVASNAQLQGVGLCNASQVITGSHFIGDSVNAVGYYNNNNVITGGSTVTTYSTFTTADVIGMASDTTGRLNYWAKNNTWQNSADPVVGTGGLNISAITGALFICAEVEDTGTITTLNAGASAYAFTPPTGYGVTPW